MLFHHSIDRIWKQFRNVLNLLMYMSTLRTNLPRKLLISVIELKSITTSREDLWDMNEADILAGRAKSVSAKHYAIYELDKLTEAYAQAWKKFEVNISENV
jgi:hypothetical protein